MNSSGIVYGAAAGITGAAIGLSYRHVPGQYFGAITGAAFGATYNNPDSGQYFGAITGAAIGVTYNYSGLTATGTAVAIGVNYNDMIRSVTVESLPKLLENWIKRSESEFDLSQAENFTKEQKTTLSIWLKKLEATKDFANAKVTLAHIVCSILQDVIKIQEFREFFFNQAESNNECCQDRAAMSLNEVYTGWKIICVAEQLTDQQKLKMLTGVAKTLCLRKQLQDLIHKQQTPQLESVEIFLYYETALQRGLGLVTAIESMTFSRCGFKSWINIPQLIQHVNTHFFEELFELPIFQKMAAIEDDTLNEQFYAQLDRLGAVPGGGPNDPQVLEHQHSQAVIMQNWKKARMELAYQWYVQQ